MVEKNTVVLNRLAQERKELMGYCRFLNNEKVTQDRLIDAMTAHCAKQVAGRHILCIQDTTEFNFRRHKHRIKDGELGPVGNNEDIGFFAHPMLAIDAEHEVSLGFGAIKLWHRDFEKRDKKERKYHQQPIEEKESYRWIESIASTKENLSAANHILVLADRESDIYQLWERVVDEKTDLLIRARGDRKLYDQPHSVRSYMAQQPVLGSYSLEVKANKKTGRSCHEALLHIKSASVKISAPEHLAKNGTKPYVALRVVQVTEDPGTVKGDEPPIHWVLLTTCEVEDFQQAQQIVRKYTLRWQVEQLFRVCKHQGVDMESSQMETGHGLMNLAVLALQVAMKVLQLTQGRDRGSVISAEITFTKPQIALLAVLVGRYEGKTTKQQNSFPRDSLAWAAWIIARMGGWKGYRSQATPGPITMHRGIVRFETMFEAWKLMQKDV